jgi:Spy/CpxP family protein refolding chaperone
MHHSFRSALVHARCSHRGQVARHAVPVYASAWDRSQPHEFSAEAGGGSFGVRRPLRFLAFKLGLREEQVIALARILDELKIERAQHAVDERRRLSALAEAVGAESFLEAKAEEAVSLRGASTQRLEAAVVKAVRQLHELLDPEQRERLAYLIRTGTLVL